MYPGDVAIIQMQRTVLIYASRMGNDPDRSEKYFYENVCKVFIRCYNKSVQKRRTPK